MIRKKIPQKDLRKKVVHIVLPEEEKKIKHCVYHLHLLMELRTSRYFVASENAAIIMKQSTERLCQAICRWQGRRMKKLELLKNPHDDRLTEFGETVISLGKVLGRLQVRYGHSYWTQREGEDLRIFLMYLAKDAAKLKRKLGRITENFLIDLRKMIHLAEKHGLTLSDQLQSQLTSDESSMENLAPESSNPKSASKTLGTILKRIKSAFKSGSVERPSGTSVDSEADPGSSNSLVKFHGSHSVKLETPTEKPNRKFLEEIAATLTSYNNLIVTKSSNNGTVETETGNQNDESFPLQAKISPIVCNELSLDDMTDIVEAQARNYFSMQNDNSGSDVKDKLIDSSKPELTDADDSKSENANRIDNVILSNKSESQESVSCTENANIANTDTDEAESKAKAKLILLMSERYKPHTARLKCNVSALLELTRDVERSWLNGTTGLKPRKESNSIPDLLRYVLETVRLLEESEVQTNLDPDKKESILQAFDTVHKAVFACFVALSELTQMAVTDVAYLRHLLEQLPQEFRDGPEHTNDEIHNEALPVHHVLYSSDTDSFCSTTEQRNRNFKIDLHDIFD